MERKRKIYKLIDPLTLEVRYIGVTVGTLSQRLVQHISESKYKKGTHKINWIQTLLKNQSKPIIELIEEVYNWEERERYWIKQYKNLTNTKEGGSGSIIDRSEDSKKRSALGHEKSIIQLNLKGKKLKEWTSIKLVFDTLGISKTAIGNVLHKRSITAGGFHWVLKSEYTSKYRIKITSPSSLKNTFRNKPVEAKFSNGKTLKFDSISECAAYFNYSPSMISSVLSNKRSLPNNTKLRYSLI